MSSLRLRITCNIVELESDIKDLVITTQNEAIRLLLYNGMNPSCT